MQERNESSGHPSRDERAPEVLAAPPNLRGRETVRVVRQRGGGADCLEADQIVAILERKLVGEARQEAERHLDRCAGCRQLVASMASGAELLVTSHDAGRASALTWVTTMHERREAVEATREELTPGDRVDHFEVVRLLGRGGMGAVYLAHDTKLERRVALKVITSDQLRAPSASERFMREARTTARVNHPSIVTIHTVGEHRGLPYLALEYVSGERLRDWMTRPRSEAEIVEVVAAIAEALAEAHRHGVLHRDLKPENVLVDRSSRVRVLDFGLAETVQIDEPPPSSGFVASARELGPIVTGLAGTPRYMAPEQWREASCSGATDVWALGVMLYEMLAKGHHPFGEPSDVIEMAARMIANDAEPLGLAPPEGASEPLAALVMRCLRREPTERPSAEVVVAELRALMSPSALDLTLPQPSRRRRSPRWPWLGAAALAFGGLLAVLVYDRAPEASAPLEAAPVKDDRASAPEKAASTSSPAVSSEAPVSSPAPGAPPSDVDARVEVEPTATGETAPVAIPVAPRPPALPATPPPPPRAEPASPPASQPDELLKKW